MSLGRRLERANSLTRQLREITRPLAAGNLAYLQCLLEVADSSMTYRQRYFTTLQPLAVLDVLMADETNPRSLAFQLEHLPDIYAKLPRHLPAELNTMRDALRTFRRLDLQAMEFPAGDNTGAGTKAFARLNRFLAELGNRLPSWSNNLSELYFSHARTLPVSME